MQKYISTNAAEIFSCSLQTMKCSQYRNLPTIENVYVVSASPFICTGAKHGLACLFSFQKHISNRPQWKSEPNLNHVHFGPASAHAADRADGAHLTVGADEIFPHTDGNPLPTHAFETGLSQSRIQQDFAFGLAADDDPLLVGALVSAAGPSQRLARGRRLRGQVGRRRPPAGPACGTHVPPPGV